ncbi:hypothetical protein AADG42_18235 [Ammonicoccus fulvus]|uniref:Uncharacterized protein n=1 Tax=Ammonicoccus fulvus TaxID=3138240 RepID=A0ABZ3FVS9_9ACTN
MQQPTLTPTPRDPRAPRCPDWCELPAGHGYDLQDADGQHRDHSWRPFTDPEVRLVIFQRETRTPMSRIVVGPVETLLAAEEAENLTPERLRQIADRLRDAANLVETIEQAASRPALRAIDGSRR